MLPQKWRGPRLFADISGHEQTKKIGTRVHIPQFDPFPISRFFFLTWAQARQRRPHMRAQVWPHYRSLQLFFLKKISSVGVTEA